MSFVRYAANPMMLMILSSSGLLVYAALVDLLAEDFLSEEAQHIMTKKNKIVAFTYVLLGGKRNSH